jgi:hypothetical protein
MMLILTEVFAYSIMGLMSVDMFNNIYEPAETRWIRILLRFMVFFFWPVFLVALMITLFVCGILVFVTDTVKLIKKTLLS